MFYLHVVLVLVFILLNENPVFGLSCALLVFLLHHLDSILLLVLHSVLATLHNFLPVLLFVNDVIAGKNVVTKIMSKSTDLQHIGFYGFSIRHWQTGYYPVAYGWCLVLC